MGDKGLKILFAITVSMVITLLIFLIIEAVWKSQQI